MPDRVISVPQATQIATRIKNKFDNVNGRLHGVESTLGYTERTVRMDNPTKWRNGWVRTNGTYGSASQSLVNKTMYAGNGDSCTITMAEGWAIDKISEYGTADDNTSYIQDIFADTSGVTNLTAILEDGKFYVFTIRKEPKTDVSLYEVTTNTFVITYTGKYSAVLDGIIEDVDTIKTALDDEKVYSNNLLDTSRCINGKYIDVDGTEKNSPSTYDPPTAYTDYFVPVEPGDVIVGTYANNTDPSSLYKVCAYDTDKNPLSALGMSSLGTSYTVPDGVAYVKVSARWFLSQNNSRLNKHGVIDKYMPFYEGTVRDTAEGNLENIGDLIRYPLTSMPSYVLKNLAYKPLGQLSKGYICFVSDDGRANLANYTIPMFTNKAVPGTWAVMSQSEVFADETMTATVVDSVQNHGCEIAVHGLSNWDNYDEYFLNQYFDWQDGVFANLGLTAYGAVCPSHHINDVISAVAGARYGCLRTGYGYGIPYYDNYMNGARSNLYGLSCYSIKDGTLQSQKDNIDKAITDHLLCIVFWHDVELTTEIRERLEEIIDYAKASGITFITVKDIPTII